MLARRPAAVNCAYCNEPIDVLHRTPAQLKKPEIFCDVACAVAKKQEGGFYKRISLLGVASTKAYKQTHGRVHQQAERAARTSENNRNAPPRAKYFTRRAHAWGYEVVFLPDEDTGAYRASVPELADTEAGQIIGIVSCATVKDGLSTIRGKFLEFRIPQRSRRG